MGGSWLCVKTILVMRSSFETCACALQPLAVMLEQANRLPPFATAQFLLKEYPPMRRILEPFGARTKVAKTIRWEKFNSLDDWKVEKSFEVDVMNRTICTEKCVVYFFVACLHWISTWSIGIDIQRRGKQTKKWSICDSTEYLLSVFSLLIISQVCVTGWLAELFATSDVRFRME